VVAWLFSKKRLSVQTNGGRLPATVANFLHQVGVPGFRQALGQLSREMDRARRYQRALTITVFAYSEGATADMRGDGGSGEAFAPGGHVLLPAILASLLREVTRGTDIVAYVSSHNRCIVVMPETGAVEAVRGVSRLRDLCVERLRCSIHSGTAVFPSDGLTLEELIRHATDRALLGARGESFVVPARSAGLAANQRGLQVPDAGGEKHLQSAVASRHEVVWSK